MYKIFFILFIGLTGCYPWEDTEKENELNTLKNEYKEVYNIPRSYYLYCINNVVYMRSMKAMAPLINPDGSGVWCNPADEVFE